MRVLQSENSETTKKAKERMHIVCRELDEIKMEADKNRNQRLALQQKLQAAEAHALDIEAKKKDELDLLEQQLNTAVKVAQETTRKSSEAIDKLQESNALKDGTIQNIRKHNTELVEANKEKQNSILNLKRDEVLLR
jgi:hypothetical protein